MLALETTASIADHRLVIQVAALTAHAGHRSPPPALAGMGDEKGDILNGPQESDWEVLS